VVVRVVIVLLDNGDGARTRKQQSAVYYKLKYLRMSLIKPYFVQWACTVVVWAVIGLLGNGDGARRRQQLVDEENDAVIVAGQPGNLYSTLLALHGWALKKLFREIRNRCPDLRTVHHLRKAYQNQ
jgi:hypothetical protein